MILKIHEQLSVFIVENRHLGSV